MCNRYYRVKLYGSALSRMESKLNQGARAHYFFTHNVTRQWTLETGVTVKRLENVNNLSNFLPSAMIIGFLDEDAYR